MIRPLGTVPPVETRPVLVASNTFHRTIDGTHLFSQDTLSKDDAILVEALGQFDHALEGQSGDDDCNTIDHELEEKFRNRPSIPYAATENDTTSIDGFDEEEGKIWFYPRDASLREYQFNIIEQCLYKNSLVCLPTGLGKTFVAVVVMYNFLRWYPNGKVIFMAPTRPLVTQQMKAYCSFLKLNSTDVAEITGSKNCTDRKKMWNSHRTFFLTPQVLSNDLRSGICPGSAIRLLVFDEAHKAMGNHAYCQVIRLLSDEPYKHRQFRVIALSATPSSDIRSIQALIANLLISHLEFRTESSSDVKPYVQDRTVETVVTPLGPELIKFRDKLFQCVIIPLRRLYQRGALPLNPSTDLHTGCIAKYALVKLRQEWASRRENISKFDNNTIQCDFSIATSLLHGIELLEQHGLRPLYHYLCGEHVKRTIYTEMFRLPGMKEFWSELNTWLQKFNDPSTPAQLGHPKFEKLRTILLQHFCPGTTGERSDPSKAIVFSQFRDSVEDIMRMLSELKPHIKPISLTGHGSTTVAKRQRSSVDGLSNSRLVGNRTKSISQREQLRTMDQFRSGVYNVLVSTCVGEEGIDVGQVDLIVCFDAFKSPTRLIQRLGRTGRCRSGRVIMLVSEGREEINHSHSVAHSSSIHKALLDRKACNKLAFYPHNPRLVPLGIVPKVEFKRITVHVVTKYETSPRKCTQIGDVTRKYFFKPGSIAKLGASSNWCARINPLSSKERIHSTRKELQYRLGFGPYGPSLSTNYLMSMLRLIELHRLGLTRLSFHALGLRSVDIKTHMDTLVGIFGSQAEAIGDAEIKRNADPPPSMGSFPKKIPLPVIGKQIPFIAHGVASRHFFMDPSVHLNYLTTFSAPPTMSTTKLTKQSLDDQWQTMLAQYPVSSPLKPASPIIHAELMNAFRTALSIKTDNHPETVDSKYSRNNGAGRASDSITESKCNMSEAFLLLENSSLRMDTWSSPYSDTSPEDQIMRVNDDSIDAAFGQVVHSSSEIATDGSESLPERKKVPSISPSTQDYFDWDVGCEISWSPIGAAEIQASASDSMSPTSKEGLSSERLTNSVRGHLDVLNEAIGHVPDRSTVRGHRIQPGYSGMIAHDHVMAEIKDHSPSRNCPSPIGTKPGWCRGVTSDLFDEEGDSESGASRPGELEQQ